MKPQKKRVVGLRAGKVVLSCGHEMTPPPGPTPAAMYCGHRDCQPPKEALHDLLPSSDVDPDMGSARLVSDGRTPAGAASSSAFFSRVGGW